MESISRISSLLESGLFTPPLDILVHLLTFPPARELTLDAATAARSSRGPPKSMPTAQIKKLLDSRNEREVLDGLKRVVSVSTLITRGEFVILAPYTDNHAR